MKRECPSLFAALLVSLLVNVLLRSQTAYWPRAGLFSAVVCAPLLAGVGWLFARLLGLETAKKRAISIEVGLQNSGLAVGLAGQFANPLCALPAAVATVAHQISGSVLANVYASMPLEKQESRKAMPELEAEAAKA